MDQGIYCDLVIALIPWLEAALLRESQGCLGWEWGGGQCIIQEWSGYL